MATVQIYWNEGDGAITATYDGSGNGTAIITSDINEGIDREQTINVSTTEGSNPKNVGVVVRQAGWREVFAVSDGEFVLAESRTFNVLK